MWSEGIRTQVGVTDPFVVKAFNQSGGGFLNQTDLRSLEENGRDGISVRSQRRSWPRWSEKVTWISIDGDGKI